MGFVLPLWEQKILFVVLSNLQMDKIKSCVVIRIFSREELQITDVKTPRFSVLLGLMIIKIALKTYT